MTKEKSKLKSKFKDKLTPTMKIWIIVTPVFAISFGLIVLFSDLVIRKTYKNLNMIMYDYSECNQAISDFREASEYLTNQVRFFVITRNPLFMTSFIYETEEVGRRNTALKIVEMTHYGDDVYDNLLRAVKESEKLNSTEFYAMKLVCEARKEYFADLPVQILNTNLSEEDLKLSNEMKLKKAQDMVYEYEYLAAKNRITRYSAGAHNSLVEYCMNVQDESDVKISFLFKIQISFLVLLLLTFFCFSIFLLVFVLHPIRKNVMCIENNKRMSLSGAKEVLTIAKAYNNLCDKNEVTASVLKHKAEHDPLTGLINREAFENIKAAYTGIKEQLAYLMIDVDFFKKINDRHGHLIGDDVLRKVSDLLIDHFRNTDYIARVGGDEFAIIMTKLGEDPEDVIARKIKNINAALLSIDDGLPKVSLSVGAAISNNGYSDELVKNADAALYTVKENGRCNCEIYEKHI